MPLSAIIEGKEVISIDVPESEWKDLKNKCQNGKLSVTFFGCNHPGHLVTKKGLQFFRHDPNTREDGCCENESVEHLRLKIDIYNHCRSLGWDAKPEANEFNGLWRPDVLAWKNGKKIAFEVQLSNISLEIMRDRDKIRKGSQVDTYWLIPKFPNGTDGYAEDVSVIADYWEPCPYEEMGFFIPDGIQTVKIYPTLDVGLWVSSVLNGDYHRILSEAIGKLTIYKTVQKKTKTARDQLENYRCRLESYKWELKNRFASRLEKDNEHPELDEKIDTINKIWDAYEKLRRDISLSDAILNDPKIYSDSSKIDDLYQTLNSVMKDDWAYQKYTSDIKWMQLGEKHWNILNHNQKSQLYGLDESDEIKNLPVGQKRLFDF